MVADPRLRKLFAIIGRGMDNGTIDPVPNQLYDVMLQVAPEFLPPENQGMQEAWDEMIDEILDGR